VEARDNTAADVLELTGGMGVDVKIEAVGYPATLLKMVASGRNPGGEDWALIRSPRPDGRGVRRVQERRRELRPQGDHSRLIPACHKSFVSFGCCNDQN
jgi:hypothetical protein